MKVRAKKVTLIITSPIFLGSLFSIVWLAATFVLAIQREIRDLKTARTNTTIELSAEISDLSNRALERIWRVRDALSNATLRTIPLPALPDGIQMSNALHWDQLNLGEAMRIEILSKDRITASLANQKNVSAAQLGLKVFPTPTEGSLFWKSSDKTKWLALFALEHKIFIACIPPALFGDALHIEAFGKANPTTAERSDLAFYAQNTFLTPTSRDQTSSEADTIFSTQSESFSPETTPALFAPLLTGGVSARFTNPLKWGAPSQALATAPIPGTNTRISIRYMARHTWIKRWQFLLEDTAFAGIAIVGGLILGGIFWRHFKLQAHKQLILVQSLPRDESLPASLLAAKHALANPLQETVVEFEKVLLELRLNKFLLDQSPDGARQVLRSVYFGFLRPRTHEAVLLRPPLQHSTFALSRNKNFLMEAFHLPHLRMDLGVVTFGELGGRTSLAELIELQASEALTQEGLFVRIEEMETLPLVHLAFLVVCISHDNLSFGGTLPHEVLEKEWGRVFSLTAPHFPDLQEESAIELEIHIRPDSATVS